MSSKKPQSNVFTPFVEKHPTGEVSEDATLGSMYECPLTGQRIPITPCPADPGPWGSEDDIKLFKGVSVHQQWLGRIKDTLTHPAMRKLQKMGKAAKENRKRRRRGKISRG